MLHRRPTAALIGLVLAAVLLAPQPDARAQTGIQPGVQPSLPGAVAPAPNSVAPTSAQDLYTVRDVQVDVTASSAAAARDRAIAEAQRTAFASLFKRLASNPNQTPPKLSDSEIDQLVQGFEVQQERASAVRYLATYTVRFRPQAVRNKMLGSGVKFTEVRSKPVLVLPVFQPAGGNPVLWEDTTAWRSAWDSRPQGQGTVPVVVPPGDLPDIADIGVKDALGGAVEPMQKIAARYGAGDVLVARLNTPGAQPDPAAGAEVSLLRLSSGGQQRTDTVKVPPVAGETLPAFLKRAVNLVVARLEESWKQDTAVEAGPERQIQVTVPIAGMQDWVQTRQRLAQVPAVTRTEVVSLNRGSAVLILYYRGEIDRLRSALALQDLGLNPTAPEGAPPGGYPAPAYPQTGFPPPVYSAGGYPPPVPAPGAYPAGAAPGALAPGGAAPGGLTPGGAAFGGTWELRRNAAGAPRAAAPQP